MRAPHFGHRPDLAAPEAASSGCTAGTASVVADAVAPPRLSAQKEVDPTAQAAPSREKYELGSSSGGDTTKKALRSLLALKGHFLSRTRRDDGPARFYITRWGPVRELTDIAVVLGFAQQVRARHA